MAKPYGIFRATCGHSGCGEFARYEADNRKHYIELSTRYGNGRWLCTRHSKPNEVLSPENPKTVEELRVIDSNGSLYWGKDKAGSGFSNGPGFKAFAKDFPPGTVLRVTAEVISPDAALAEVVGEPVEWQRFVDGFGWQRVNDEDVQHYRDKGVRLRPLYAALSVPAEAVVGEPVGYLFEMHYGNGRWSGTMFAEAINIPPEDVRNVRPLYAAPSAPEGWLPIASAPRDGTRVIVWDEEFIDRAVIASFTHGRWWPDGEDNIKQTPRFWCPLPEAPK